MKEFRAGKNTTLYMRIGSDSYESTAQQLGLGLWDPRNLPGQA